MRTVALVQARMTSTRLPGKVLEDLAGRPLLERVLTRVASARLVDDVVVATTTNDTDDPVVRLADATGNRWYRGSEHDVLERFVGAARDADAEVVVRVTADCPLLDPAVIDRVCAALLDGRDRLDYCSNVVVRSYPRGLDVEALFVDVLERVARMATADAEREHVTSMIYGSRPQLFAIHDVVADVDDSDLRWTVDQQVDLDVVRDVYGALDLGERIVPYRDVVAWCRANPERALRNVHVTTWSPPGVRPAT